MVKILLIEEDVETRKRIKGFLEKSNIWQNFGYPKVFTAETGKDGIDLAKEILPDVIICNTNLLNKTGYEVKKELNKYPETEAIIFIFLIDRSDLDEFRNGMTLGADDYILNPFNEKDLIESILIRFKKRTTLKKYFQQEINNSINNKSNEDNNFEHILLNVNHKPHLIKIKEILCIKADGEYSKVFLINGNIITVCKSLKKWEKVLPQKIFVRTHRSTIINLGCIEKIERWYKRSYRIYLKNLKESFMVSQRYASKLKEDILF